MENNIFKNQKGSAVIFMTLMVMVSVLGATMAFSDLAINGLKSAKTQSDSVASYFAAETGAEALIMDYLDDDDTLKSYTDDSSIKYNAVGGAMIELLDTAPSVTKVNVGSATYSVRYYLDGTDESLIFTGDYKGSTRKIKISY